MRIGIAISKDDPQIGGGLAMLQIPPEAIKNGKLSFGDFDQHHKNVCGTDSIASFTVSFNPERPGSNFANFGTFDLPTRFGIDQAEVFE
jgi:hypothetical protein